MERSAFSGTRELLNTLFVMTPGAYVRLENETVRVEVADRAEGLDEGPDGDKTPVGEGEAPRAGYRPRDKVVVQVPLHHISGIVLFAANLVTPGLMMRCAQEGRAITFLDWNGRFQARVVGDTTGNVLLRKAQQDAHRDDMKCAAIARAMVAGKLQNERAALLRAARESKSGGNADFLREGAEQVGALLAALPGLASLDEIRGHEGQAANTYFNLFDTMILAQRTDFGFAQRTRRPPRDRVNALISFLYALLATDCTSAIEGVGLDPQFGYLHAIRPGRPALALDLMEEFRTPLCDRLALGLVNRKEITPDAFDARPGGSVMLNEKGRKLVIVAYQKRKQAEAAHPLLKQDAPLGLFPHLQARILARHLRGDIPSYVPFVPK